MATGSAVALVVMALFTSVDVVLRYVFNRPIVGSIDVIQLMLVVLIFLALPYAGRSGAHIIVDLVPDYPSKRLGRIRDAIVSLLSAFAFGILTWQACLRAAQAAMLDEASNILVVPFWPFFYVMAAGAALYSVALVLESLVLIGGQRAASVTVGLDEELASQNR
jgi:TRAP-type C4-dicarboxylate transport system permease small subunit